MQVATFVIPAGNNFKTSEFEEYVAGQELVKVSFLDADYRFERTGNQPQVPRRPAELLAV